MSFTKRKYNLIYKILGLIITERATILILFCWFYAIIWSIPPFIGWGKYIPEGILDSCSFDYLTRDDRVSNIS